MRRLHQNRDRELEGFATLGTVTLQARPTRQQRVFSTSTCPWMQHLQTREPHVPLVYLMLQEGTVVTRSALSKRFHAKTSSRAQARNRAECSTTSKKKSL